MILDEDECKAIQWILDYLETVKSILKEREINFDTLRTYPQWNHGKPEDQCKFVRYFWDTGCFEKEFGNTLFRVFD